MRQGELLIKSKKRNIKAIIEARMSSTRLPGKVLRPILGKPALELMIERLRKSVFLDGIIVATTVNNGDDQIKELADRLNVNCYRGSEDDVLLRVVEAAEFFSAGIIVEVTGDCPLIDPEVVDKVISVYINNNFDYVANCIKQTYPAGMDTQVFSTEKLRKVERLTADPADREHVSLYFYEKPGRFNIFNVESGMPEKYSKIRLTLDTMEDFKLIEHIFGELYPIKNNFDLNDILHLLDKRKDLKKINSAVKQKKVR